MPVSRRAANTILDLACHAAGRRAVVRASRFALNKARLDLRNDMFTNGETALQAWALKLTEKGDGLHILDVGANVGMWSLALLEAAERSGRLNDIDLHSFEPSRYTFRQLTTRLEGKPATARRLALSDCAGSSTLFVDAPGAGTNSLHAAPEFVLGAAATEVVSTTTLDAYVKSAGLGRIDLLRSTRKVTTWLCFAVLAACCGLAGWRSLNLNITIDGYMPAVSCATYSS